MVVVAAVTVVAVGLRFEVKELDDEDDVDEVVEEVVEVVAEEGNSA